MGGQDSVSRKVTQVGKEIDVGNIQHTVAVALASDPVLLGRLRTWTSSEDACQNDQALQSRGSLAELNRVTFSTIDAGAQPESTSALPHPTNTERFPTGIIDDNALGVPTRNLAS